MNSLIWMFIVFPIPISLLIPGRWLLPWTLLIAQVTAVIWIDYIRRSQCGGCGSSVEALVYLVEVLIIVLVLVTRFILFAKAESSERQAAGADIPVLASWILGAVGGAVVLTVLWVLVWNSALDSGLATHVAVVVLAIIWFVLTPLAWSNRPSLNTIRTFHPSNIFRFAGALVICGTLAWSMQVSLEVAKAAQAAAQELPYCLLVPGARGLRPARSHLDLTGFVMQADHGVSRHATLAVGDAHAPQWFYWSYRKETFENGVMGGVLSCDLQRDFAANLSWFSSAQPEGGNLPFWLGGGQWQIPEEFYGSASDAPPELHFYANGKTFAPPTGVLVRNGPQDWNQIRQSVNVLLCTPEKLHVWHTRNDTNFKVQSVSKLYGLDKQRVQHIGGGKTHFQYVEYDHAGQARTWLECEDDKLDCHHAFSREGIVISFMHSGKGFGEWKSLQDALWLRLKSFSVVWPDASPLPCVR